MESSEIIIRYATAGDNMLLAELGAQTFHDTYAAHIPSESLTAYLAASFSPNVQAAELADPSTFFLIAEIENEAVGYAKLQASEPPAGITGARPLELVRIYVLQAWIGRGVGAKLLQACLREASGKGYDSIWLGVWERNPRAQAFYRKWGFVDAGTQIFQLGDIPQTDLLMQRSL